MGNGLRPDAGLHDLYAFPGVMDYCVNPTMGERYECTSHETPIQRLLQEARWRNLMEQNLETVQSAVKAV
ncbi:MAG: hypothetical protein LC791_14950 [Acidobacteria bacterium]|nr:hypothetical protein [Acidobacteriota bacterium]